MLVRCVAVLLVSGLAIIVPLPAQEAPVKKRVRATVEKADRPATKVIVTTPVTETECCEIIECPAEAECCEEFEAEATTGTVKARIVTPSHKEGIPMLQGLPGVGHFFSSPALAEVVSDVVMLDDVTMMQGSGGDVVCEDLIEVFVNGKKVWSSHGSKGAAPKAMTGFIELSPDGAPGAARRFAVSGLGGGAGGLTAPGARTFRVKTDGDKDVEVLLEDVTKDAPKQDVLVRRAVQAEKALKEAARAKEHATEVHRHHEVLRKAEEAQEAAKAAAKEKEAAQAAERRHEKEAHAARAKHEAALKALRDQMARIEKELREIERTLEKRDR